MGYGHYPPGAFPNPFPHPGDMQPTVQARVMPVHAEGVSQASLPPRGAPFQTRVMPVRTEVLEGTNQAAPSEFQPKRIYPNKQVSEGGMLHSNLS
jgi:hypothetical protein